MTEKDYKTACRMITYDRIQQFVSFLFVPQQGKHITEQAQSYAGED